MMFHRRPTTSGPGRIVAAGLLAGGAYLASQAIDLAITRNRVDDTVLLGGLLTASEPRARSIGTVMHLANTVVFSWAYARFGRDRLAGPHWLRGVGFALIENTALYAVTALEDFHPAIRDGRLDSYRTWEAFAQGTWRHIWMGLVLGILHRPRR